MRVLGTRARRPARIYLVGGATAVLNGWRPTTIDESQLYRYPAIDPATFRRAVEEVVRHYP